jgi:hypothetical protein
MCDAPFCAAPFGTATDTLHTKGMGFGSSSDEPL